MGKAQYFLLTKAKEEILKRQTNQDETVLAASIRMRMGKVRSDRGRFRDKTGLSGGEYVTLAGTRGHGLG